MSKTIKTTILGLAGATMLATAASAGGFSRGTADTDILYDPENFSMRAGVTIVSPHRTFSANANPALVGTDNTDTYVIPSAAIKFGVIDNLDCAGTFTTPYGGAVTNAAPSASGILKESFTISELGATCSYKFKVGPGNLRVLGGAFIEQFNYERTNFTPFGGAQLSLQGQDTGFRAGLGYEVPEIALRAQLLYRGSTSYGANGTLGVPGAALAAQAAIQAGAVALGGTTPAAGVFAAAAQDPANAIAIVTGAVGAGTITPVEAGAIQTQLGNVQAAIAAAPAGAVPLNATGLGNLPQSLELKLQSGVAPGWLVFGSVKWTDWSVLKQLIVNSPAGTQTNDYFWKDGWTITAGVGHQFNDTWSGAAGLTWDRGVGTGFDLSSDTWTVFAGANAKVNQNSELQLGGALTRLTAASEYNVTNGAATKGGWAYALSASFKAKF